MNTSTPAPFPFAGFPRPAASLTYTYDQVVSRALAQPVEQPPRGTSNTGAVKPQVFLPLIFALFLLLALVSLIGTWYTNDSYGWMPFWIFSGFGFLLYGFFLLGAWFVHERELHLRTHPVVPTMVSLAALRAAVLTGNDQVVPPIYVPTFVSNGDDPLTEDQSAEPLVLSLMPPERRLLRMRQLIFWALFVPACLLASVELLMFGSGSIGQFMPWQIAILGPMLPVELVYIFVVTNGSARTRRVRIEANGLHWSRFALPWSEMRGLCVLLLQPRRRRAALGPDAIYAVFGQYASLTWYVDASNEAAVNTSAALLGHIQSQTGLPFRDITPGFIWSDAENQRTLGFARSKLLTINDRTIGGIYMPSLRSALLLFCLATLVLLAGIGMPFAQQRYFGSQLARLESAQDAMRDPLTSNRQQWTPTSADVAKSFAFTPQGYRLLSTTCCNSSSLIARTIGNGLVEVTVHQQVEFDLDEAGIMFHVDPSSSTALAFVVTPNGEWHLNRFRIGSDGTLIDEGSLRYEGVFGGIRVVYQGHDTVNRLAVLMQGDN